MTGSVEIDIYYEDTDCGGVVYYANYLNYFERGRTELLRTLDVDPVAWAKDGVTFAVIRAEVFYKSPAVYGDRLLVTTTLAPTNGVRLNFSYTITVGEERRTVVTGETDMACLNEKMRPQRIPTAIVGKLGPER